MTTTAGCGRVVMPRPVLTLAPGQEDELLAAALVHPLNLLKRAALDDIGPRMRALCPLPGHGWSLLRTVLLEPGEDLPMHEHQGYAVIFYPPRLARNAVIRIASGLYEPAPGEVLNIPPSTPHGVPRHAERRVTVAMRVELPRDLAAVTGAAAGR